MTVQNSNYKDNSRIFKDNSRVYRDNSRVFRYTRMTGTEERVRR